ncbi:PsiF family protein [Achromobacter aloeverae]|uniref:PsiF repeat family protein n=1 Tax=Achromobacter aloeverae TaxID=1750518 RepID=A0A4Q1HNC0_9BURK|nr:PsiF family protein [Achromobacter aloeverae]RXN91462.1 PsiF repeat family protein [Achromobacter aloeverae]
MKNRSSLLFAAALLAASCSAPVWAQTTPAPAAPGASKTPATPSTGKTLTPQQQRMSECSTANKGKTGEAYKAGVASCLKGEKPAENGKALTPQQQRMKDCNAQAATKSLSGDARKTFMSTCLKGKS